MIIIMYFMILLMRIKMQLLVLTWLRMLKLLIKKFIKERCQQDVTFRFWNMFLEQHCTNFIGFYYAIRSGNFKLRMYYLKKMARLFAVNNSLYYEQLIPRHIADLA